MESVNRLTEVGSRISELQDTLRASEPELYEELDTLIEEKQKLVEAAKKELREKGVGKHSIGGFSFRVSAGKVVHHYDPEDLQELAEELGHEELLEKYGVFKRAVDPKQISRLPPEIKAHYEPLCTTSTHSARVTLPKELK
jgi:hypothetical protein